MSWLTVSESILACIRKSLFFMMASRMSQRRCLSEAMPWALWFLTSDSMSEIMMASLPTTATVLSTTLYFCAKDSMQQKKSMNAMDAILFIRNKFQICHWSGPHLASPVPKS